jgi:folate-binding protein YgfZ
MDMRETSTVRLTILHFFAGDNERSMPSGYDALRTTAAWLDLSTRGRIYATGEDRARLLHAMLTNHVQQLKPGEGCYAFFLNAQGHVQADVNLLCLEDRFLLDIEPETRERVFRHLDKYIIADDVALADVTEAVACLAVEGPHAAAMLAAIGAPAPEADFAHAAWTGAIVQRASATGEPGFRIFLPAGEKAAWMARLESAGAIPATADEARTVRLEHGRPRYGEDIFDTTLPQETRQMHAVHFAKGCYLGQEIVERIRSRGHVNRLLVRLEIEGDAPVPGGTRITSGDAEAGEITSSAFSPALGKAVALGYVRAQFAAEGTPLQADGRAAMAAGDPLGRVPGTRLGPGN